MTGVFLVDDVFTLNVVEDLEYSKSDVESGEKRGGDGQFGNDPPEAETGGTKFKDWVVSGLKIVENEEQPSPTNVCSDQGSDTYSTDEDSPRLVIDDGVRREDNEETKASTKDSHFADCWVIEESLFNNPRIYTDAAVKKVYECRCGFISFNEICYRRHVLDHTSQERCLKRCKYCTYSTFNKAALTSHLVRNCLKSKCIKCPNCKFRTLKWRNMNIHIRTMHIRDKKKKRMINTQRIKYFKCKVCVFFSTEKEELTKHKCQDFENIKST